MEENLNPLSAVKEGIERAAPRGILYFVIMAFIIGALVWRSRE